MIIGIGTDIVEISRIKEAVEKWGERFLKKIFTDNEIAYCNQKKDPYPHLSARFAAKEAVIKASSSLREMHLAFHAIEILNEPSGKPFIKILNSKPFTLNSFIIHLTLTHERNYAVATVVVERKNS
ncbi:MAG: holo-ACP synthase [Nitrospirae bacterium]|nr:holo-ACP synthase [Nitrospirota bacterium]